LAADVKNREIESLSKYYDIKSIDEKFIPELNWYLDNIIEKHFTCLNSKIEETVREFINDIPRNRLKKAVTVTGSAFSGIKKIMEEIIK